MAYDLPVVQQFVRLEQVRGFGLLIAARLERLGSTVRFEVAGELQSAIRAMGGVASELNQDELRALKRYGEVFRGDDVSIAGYYQSIAVQVALSALSVGGEDLLGASRRLMFMAMNAWQSIDGLSGLNSRGVCRSRGAGDDGFLKGELSWQIRDADELSSGESVVDAYRGRLSLICDARGEFSDYVGAIPEWVGWRG